MSTAQPPRRLTVLMGPPGSGKTTWAHAQTGATVISAAQISPRKLLTSAQDAIAAGAADVIIDRTAAKAEHREPFLALAKAHRYATRIIRFDVDAATCEDRIRRRPGGSALPTARAASAVFQYFEALELPAAGEADEVLTLGANHATRQEEAQPAKAPAEPAKPATAEETRDKLILLLVSGMGPAAVAQAAADKLKIPPAAVKKEIAAARRQIAEAAAFDKRHQAGVAITRLQDIYRRSLAVQDTKTALAAQRELAKLLDLYKPTKPAEAQTAGSTDEAATIAAALRHLAPLGLAAEGAPLPELCRLAALKIIDLEGQLEPQDQ